MNSTATPVPARRTAASAKSEQRIRDILRVGREVFAERGYEAATTTEVAQRLGISEATVFTYFRSKRELCMRVIADWYDEIIEATEAGAPQDVAIATEFDYRVRTHLRLFLGQGRGMCALVLSEGRAKGQAFAEALPELQRRYTAAMMDLLARGQAQGVVRQDVGLRLLRSLVFGPMEHVLWEVLASGRQPDVDASADAMVGLLWPTLQAPEVELQALRRFKGEVTRALSSADS